MVMTEDQLQAACFQWLWNAHPEMRRCFWHVPNGKGRSIVDAVQLKAMGVVAGVSDMHVFWQSRLYIIELKTEVGRLSKAQELYKECMTKQGAKFYVCRELATWITIIECDVLKINTTIPTTASSQNPVEWESYENVMARKRMDGM